MRTLSGELYGTEWAYFWTRVTSFVEQFGREIFVDRAEDDGSWDERIEGLGLTKIPLTRFGEVFGPFGLSFPQLREAA